MHSSQCTIIVNFFVTICTHICNSQKKTASTLPCNFFSTNLTFIVHCELCIIN